MRGDTFFSEVNPLPSWTAKVVMLVCLSPFCLWAQTEQSQAQTVLNSAVAAAFGGKTPANVLFEGTVKSHFGTDDAGSFTADVSGNGDSRVTLNLAGGSRTEILKAAGGEDQCAWLDAKGESHKIAEHNCWAVAAWMLPAFQLAHTGGGSSLVAAESTTDYGLSVSRPATTKNETVNQKFAALSSTQVLFDKQTMLASRLTLNTHPDDDLQVNIPVDVRYADYRDAGGVKAPYRIEKYMNGTLVLEFTVTAVNIQ